ncbi:acetyl-CoA carboxylase biotin carboxyl carrier protein subunit [Dyadobacter fermentans]|uniref:Biotin/lipoyl attachment domain-containing protein n=1 Tax=Dyadobacter fermentans (strain ATCC 700827 / DSM 18053 / CIP 107007 / KCTC 52180 / NS114) TaxID=471854 RepID=C6W5J4_DYAFD|nr:acetyl-CoA carboxylase biotin carboxyl carrier protein subunit [Dyadobacter fermentans]ACT94212.1 biotin/lipoyl attachment domain-containing protein [Dyadobacter fermentans DSM 18053]
MLKVNVGNKPQAEQPENGQAFEIDQRKEGWFINGNAFDGDIAALGNNRFHVIWQNKSYNIEVISRNAAEKTTHLLINGQHYHTTAKDDLDLLLEKMGMQNSSAQKINNVKAPMPGLIQSIAVAEGDSIAKGDNLLVLVAMKMENVIKSSGSGVIKSLKVAPGQIVEKNQVLLEFH